MGRRQLAVRNLRQRHRPGPGDLRRRPGDRHLRLQLQLGIGTLQHRWPGPVQGAALRARRHRRSGLTDPPPGENVLREEGPDRGLPRRPWRLGRRHPRGLRLGVPHRPSQGRRTAAALRLPRGLQARLGRPLRRPPGRGGRAGPRRALQRMVRALRQGRPRRGDRHLPPGPHRHPRPATGSNTASPARCPSRRPGTCPRRARGRRRGGRLRGRRRDGRSPRSWCRRQSWRGRWR
jgi:hypothetical protein